MFLQWCGDVLPKVYIFVQRLVSGTGRGFGSAPLKKHKRYAQCRGTDSVLRILALLLAAHSRATPKQAKEPILTALNGLFASKLFWTFKHLIKAISVI
jgi:hypothetical protein